MADKAVDLFLIMDHTRQDARDANWIKRVVDGELQKPVTHEMVVTQMFYLAVIVRDLASEISRLAAIVGDMDPYGKATEDHRNDTGKVGSTIECRSCQTCVCGAGQAHQAPTEQSAT
jgi:hypothetical protein